MHNFDVRNISLGQIQYFSKIVECNSFTKAASYLHLTQSTISKSIASMETMLGIQLFLRDKHNIRLTPAGRYFYDKWKNIPGLVENTVKEAYIIQRGYFRSISVGVLDSHRLDVFLLPTVESFQQNQPDIRIRIETCSAQNIRKMLVEDELDVIFTVLYDSCYLNYAEYNCELLCECSLEVCMRKTNPLASKTSLNLSDLKPFCFIAISPLYTPSYTEMLRTLCAPYGFIPDFSSYTSNANSLPLNLISGNDVFICDKFYRDYGSEHLRFIPLEGTKSGIAMCWRKNNVKKETELFIEEIRAFAKKTSFLSGMG